MSALFALLLAVDPALQLESAARCAESSSVAAYLAELVHDAALGKGHIASLEEFLSAENGHVTVSVRVRDADNKVVLDRTISDLDCKEAPRTVATVLAVWMEVFQQNRAAPAPAQPVTTQVFAPKPIAPPPPAPKAPPPTIKPAPASPAWELAFAGRLGTELAIARASDPGLATALAGGVGKGPWQGWLSLEFGADHAAALQPQGASVKWNRNTIGLSLARVFGDDGRNPWLLRLAAGGRLALTDASGVGVTKSNTDTAVVPGLGANAALLWRTRSGIRPLLQIGANLWPGNETVRISGVSAGDLPRSDLSITLGIEFALTMGSTL